MDVSERHDYELEREVKKKDYKRAIRL
jgi:hypothetical protein